MKFRHFLLLAIFAAFGLGLAVWLVQRTSGMQAAKFAFAGKSPSDATVGISADDEVTRAAKDRAILKAAKADFAPAAIKPHVAADRSTGELPSAPMPPRQADLPTAPLPPRQADLLAPERGPGHFAPLLARTLDPPIEQIPVPPLPGLAPASSTPQPPARMPLLANPPANFPSNRGTAPVVKVESQNSGKLKIHIQNAELREVLDLLAEQGKLNILAGKEVQGKVSVSLDGVDIETALDAVLKSTGFAMRKQGKFIFVGTPDEFSNMEQALDRVSTRIYRPNYVTAAELKTLITPLLTEKTGMVSVSSAAEAGIAASDAQAGGDKYAGGEVVLVRDYQAVLNQIDQVVSEIDVRPLQVSIEAMIMSVSLNDSCKFGVDFALLQNYLKFGWGTPAASLSDVKFDQGGLKFGYFDGNVGTFVQALESIADTDIIAKPRVMVLNKQRTEILIGNKKGYISTTVTETASTQTVDFLQTGVQLRLRPFVSRDGLIRMEVHPELSDGDVTVQGNFTLPNETVTEVTSNVMVRDGCTVVIGGLLRDQKTVSTQAVPFFGSLPYVGFLFRDQTEGTTREELIVLLTPRIVYDPCTAAEGKHDQCLFEHRQDVYTDTMLSPISRRAIARRYLNLAEARCEQGDCETAMRFANLAVHFDPQNNDAIVFRETLAGGSKSGATTRAAEIGGTRPQRCVAPTPNANGPEVSDWMLDDLKHEGPAAPAGEPLHPFDPGQPGTARDIVRPRQLP